MCDSNPLLPDYPLDNGADPNQSAFRPWCALHYAITGGQSIIVIIQMIKAGAYVTSSEVLYAVRRADPDISGFLLQKCRHKIQGKTRKYVVKALKDCETQEMTLKSYKKSTNDSHWSRNVLEAMMPR